MMEKEYIVLDTNVLLMCIHPQSKYRCVWQAFLNVEPTGHYILEDTEGLQRRYAFKEVSFCL